MPTAPAPSRPSAVDSSPSLADADAVIDLRTDLRTDRRTDPGTDVRRESRNSSALGLGRQKLGRQKLGRQKLGRQKLGRRGLRKMLRTGAGVAVVLGLPAAALIADRSGSDLSATNTARVSGADASNSSAGGPSTFAASRGPADQGGVRTSTSIAQPTQTVPRNSPPSIVTQTGAVPPAQQPSTTVVGAPAWRLASPVAYANGAIRARPLPKSVQPSRRRSIVTATATKLAAQQFGGTLRPADIDTYFAEFDAPVGEWLGKVDSVETEPRAAWFVVFSGMESQRASGIVLRKKDRLHPPTTVSLQVVSDVVVVIDDETGEVLVASEFLSNSGPAASTLRR